MKKLYLLIPFIAVLFSCSQPNQLEQALILAGKNRTELEKVLTHYKTEPKDSLKYKAACFLIENMPVHFYLEESPENYHLMDSLNQSDFPTDSIYVRFNSIRGFKENSELQLFLDVKTLSAKFLIEHIEKSFNVWENSPWYKHIKFDAFCDYILPYAVSYEKREQWINYFHYFILF